MGGSETDTLAESPSQENRRSHMKRRVYIAGPMRGLPGLNFPAFHQAAIQLAAEGYEVFNPADLPLSYDERHCFAADMQYISLCADEIAMLPGWRDSLGATAEWYLARALGLTIREMD